MFYIDPRRKRSSSRIVIAIRGNQCTFVCRNKYCQHKRRVRGGIVVESFILTNNIKDKTDRLLSQSSRLLWSIKKVIILFGKFYFWYSRCQIWLLYAILAYKHVRNRTMRHMLSGDKYILLCWFTKEKLYKTEEGKGNPQIEYHSNYITVCHPWLDQIQHHLYHYLVILNIFVMLFPIPLQ